MDKLVSQLIDIVACADKGYIMPTGVMMLSVCVNNPNVNVVFHIITDKSVTDDNYHDLENVVNPYPNKSVQFYIANENIINNTFPKGNKRRDLTKIVYYDLFISKILPESIDKVLYLDGDVIVRHQLFPLWNIDLGQYALAAAHDFLKDTEFVRLKYHPRLGYFNSGVLLINLRYWREYQVIDKFVRYMTEHTDDIQYHDQDVMNVVFCNKVLWLPVKFNLHNFILRKGFKAFNHGLSEDELNEALQDPCIVHFSGSKPWYRYQRYPHPFKSTWVKYQNQTKWKGVTYERRPIKLRVINFVADFLRKMGLKSKVMRYEYIEIEQID